MRRRLFLAVMAGVVVMPWASAAGVKPAAADWDKVVGKAYESLKAKQNADGSFAPKLGGPGITALVAAALIKCGKPANDPVVEKALAYLEKSIKPDGGIYDKGLANYTTCLAIMAFQEANANGKYKGVIDKATKFLRSLQDGSTDMKDPSYGGMGYDGKGRPDLSNTQFFVEALLAAGVAKDDPAIVKAMAFVSRSQNLAGEFNDQPFATKATEEEKGGFVYNLTEQGKEKSEKRTASGGLRSEGGMTYAGLKSFLYAGISKDDVRVQAAVKWIRKHYSVSENPGMGTAGLFYYYTTFAKAMTALGEDEFTDAEGKKHPWRMELFEKLQKTQKENGAWANDNKAFLENQEELATAFALLALGYCK
ncbi:MAG: prenyltransferase/squalene oxidase repeat-containing protein [Fimbriiglobus sp.]